MPTPLRPDGGPVAIRDVVLRTPGLRGQADMYDAHPGVRSAAATAPVLNAALAEAEFTAVRTIELTRTSETATPPGAVRASTPYGEDALVVDVPAPPAAYEQVVLLQDEAGVITWNFAVPQRAAAGTTRGKGARRTYVLRRYVPTPGTATRRGLLGALNTKVIKVLAFPIRRIAGGTIVSLLREWEMHQRPYGLAVVDASSYASPVAAGVPDDTWHKLAAGVGLLLIHGTFSRCGSTYGQLPRELVERLVDRYGGRVLAFDHLTMSETPRENVDWLLQRIPRDVPLKFDVVAHSRGGLVARTLSERLAELGTGHDLSVRTAVLVGVPDNGTALTDGAYMSDFLDAFTNILNFFPDSTAMDVLQCVLAAVKEVARGAIDQLTGLQAMLPNGDFQRWLNAGPKTHSRYFAVASSFAPSQNGLKEWAEQRLMRRIFREDNDLVVPTAGVYDANGSGYFPVTDDDRLVFGPDDGVNHCEYFAQPRLRGKLADWLVC